MRDVTPNLDLVHFEVIRARRRLPSHVRYDELWSAGAEGLVKAGRDYDPTQSDNFPAYARMRVRHAILDELRAQDYVPRSIRQRDRELYTARDQLTRALQRPPTLEEWAGELRITPDELITRERQCHEVVLAPALSEQGATPEWATEELPDGPTTPDETRKRVAAALAKLPDRERIVLSLYYFEELTQEEIAETIERTESRVCQILTRARARLGHILTRQAIRSGHATPSPVRGQVSTRSSNRRTVVGSANARPSSEPQTPPSERHPLR